MEKFIDELTLAAFQGCPEVVKEMLDPRPENIWFSTCLEHVLIAALDGAASAHYPGEADACVSVVLLAIKLGVNPNFDGGTPLRVASGLNHMGITNALIAAGARLGAPSTVLLCGAAQGNGAAVAEILATSYFPPYKIQEAKRSAFRGGHDTIVAMLGGLN